MWRVRMDKLNTEFPLSLIRWMAESIGWMSHEVNRTIFWTKNPFNVRTKEEKKRNKCVIGLNWKLIDTLNLPLQWTMKRKVNQFLLLMFIHIHYKLLLFLHNNSINQLGLEETPSNMNQLITKLFSCFCTRTMNETKKKKT